MQKYKTNPKDSKILAIIPARGGSKGIPNKNIRLLVGKPLIAWSIDEALKSKYINRVIVSTDSDKLAYVSERHKAETVKRSDRLATDTAKVIDVALDLLNFLKKQKYEPDIIILLQPTSPLRTVQDIDKSIRIFLEGKCESVVSFYESDSIAWSFKIERGYAKPFLGKKYLKTRRQDLPNIYLPNGAIYVCTPKSLFKYKSFYGKKVLPYIMSKNRSIDIDYEIDLKIVELTMKRKA
jgi:CMP-N-acetylneuraminic acid synthetase